MNYRVLLSTDARVYLEHPDEKIRRICRDDDASSSMLACEQETGRSASRVQLQS
jgi:hypothetical protein